MVILLIILLVSAITMALFYRSKAKEFESLFELSKGYEPSIDITKYAKGKLEIEITDKRLKDYLNESLASISGVKLNKDGSIAKKRGGKPRVTITGPYTLDEVKEAERQGRVVLFPKKRGRKQYNLREEYTKGVQSKMSANILAEAKGVEKQAVP